MNKVLTGNSLDVLKTLDDNSIDAVITDPPYGYSFMGKDWDKAVPSVEIWQECLRVLKPGAFCMVMSAPRSDVQMHMISNLEQAGFRVDFTPIYWTYASGFPKAGNIGKMVDKRRWGSKVNEIRHYLRDVIKASPITNQAIKQHLGYDSKSGVVSNWTVTDSGASVPSGKDWLKLKEVLPLDDRYDDLILEVEREELGRKPMTIGIGGSSERMGAEKIIDEATSPQAKALDGSYAGFQPKPAVEVIIVAMKPLSEKTFVDQALKNGKGITWLDDCRIPYRDEADKGSATPQGKVTSNIAAGARPDVDNEGRKEVERPELLGRFPANILECDNILAEHGRYFDLDKWANTLPFLITPKASKREKNEGLEGREPKAQSPLNKIGGEANTMLTGSGNPRATKYINNHPTVKPLKLMSYLITLTTREGDTVLDPFCGSGTTCIAAKMLKRDYIGIEREAEYVEIAEARLKAHEPDPQLELLDVR